MASSVRVCVFLADGFEEIEAVTIIDVLRRAEVSVDIAAVGARRELWRTGAHGLVVQATTTAEAVDADRFDALVLPGGQPGSTHLSQDARVQELVKSANRAGRIVAAICAAPLALESAGVLKGRRATSFPGVSLPSAEYLTARVVRDGNLITSRGPGTAFDFALTLVEQLVSEALARRLSERMLVSPTA